MPPYFLQANNFLRLRLTTVTNTNGSSCFLISILPQKFLVLWAFFSGLAAPHISYKPTIFPACFWSRLWIPLGLAPSKYRFYHRNFIMFELWSLEAAQFPRLRLIAIPNTNGSNSFLVSILSPKFYALWTLDSRPFAATIFPSSQLTPLAFDRDYKYHWV